MIDPVIVEWGLQWNVYVPGVRKVNENDSPCASAPESQVPVSDVHVCVVPSLFVARTVVPVLTVIDLGSNAKFSMVSAVAAAGGGADGPGGDDVSVARGVGVGVGGGFGFGFAVSDGAAAGRSYPPRGGGAGASDGLGPGRVWAAGCGDWADFEAGDGAIGDPLPAGGDGSADADLVAGAAAGSACDSLGPPEQAATSRQMATAAGVLASHPSAVGKGWLWSPWRTSDMGSPPLSHVPRASFYRDTILWSR
jgi:hypothetical protein